MIETERLILRRWRREDRDAFAVINADPHVMEFMTKQLDRSESDVFADRIDAHFVQHGHGLYAVELKEDKTFIGFTGLSHVPFEAHFTPAVEIGWRIAQHAWGNGYAPEAAKQVLSYAFENFGLEEIVSFTALGNIRSQNVMKKIGMKNQAGDDFDHPRLEKSHPLCRHVLYRIKKS